MKSPTNRPGESKKSSVLSRPHPKIEANPRTFSEKKRRPEIPKEENSHVLLRKKETRNKRSSDVRCVTIVVIEKKVVKKTRQTE